MKSSRGGSTNITIESGTIIRVLGLVVATLFLIGLLLSIVKPLTLILISGFLALALNPAVSWIASKLKSKSRIRATGAAYLLVITFLVGFFSVVLPPLVSQTVEFVKDVPETIQGIKNDDSGIGAFVQRYDLDSQIDQFTDDFGSRFQDLGKPALSTAGKVGTMVVSVITIFVLTFMMLVEGPMWLRKYFDALPAKRRKHHKELAHKMYRVVVGYVNGQVIIAALGGIFTTIALFISSQILGVEINAIALGGIIALFALMPLIGTTLGATIVVLACLFVSVPLAIIMVLFIIIYQQIENVTIQPHIQARSSNLTPLIVFTAAVIGIGLGGILGAFLAIPTAGIIKVLVEDYFDRKNNSTTSKA